MVKRFNAEKAPAAIGPYCHATIANGVLYSSGQIPLDPETNELVIGGIEVATDQVMKNLAAVLEEAGSSWDKVLKMNLFLTDMDDFPIVNEVYARYVGEYKPARSTVQVAKLPKGVSIEIDCIALISE
ncbi:MAG: reactive intermediate/imine deaminase [SAR324 cluster bacterium]|uniref:Reactive intermediate/imine deaminase n=1 Tax=SAR324 cluster bacterium TaxID=2024889 RepID=A0A2A4T378_9DELT|nr:MAG: reactive intermediate/imine deaminase [SAR324 cluster bacterium]